MYPLLMALQMAASGPGDPPLRKLTPFTTDTLFRIAGGPVPMYRSRNPSPLGPLNVALTRAPLRPMQGDTSVTFYQDPTDHVTAHEMGHVIDHRNLIPLVLASAAAQRRPYEGQQPQTMDDYFRSTREEYVAEAFARAVLSGRRGFSDSTKVDRDFPGAIDIIRWLQTQAPFKKESGDHVQK